MTDSQTHERFMRIALEEAARSAEESNQGVGSIIVRDGEIIGRGRNLENTEHDPTAHAESVAIRNYAASKYHPKAQESWNQYFSNGPVLTGTTLYSTFEPCPMCCGAILATGISTLVLGGRPKPGTSKWGDYTLERLVELTARGERVEVITGVLPDECFNIRNT
ncbi:MAG: nucleoside deaminase [Chloroflexi bacterium]|jgi:tRNA(adenine34) deaminase|nr:nucleoside deaminase [Chloroflexota bacterium]MBT4073835.1 nucleoside deaminase [Chloroflexota bacterium]MBT4516122.1 nucleoside deaminase [Chloroflexota bacterium]MBT5319337.1 nucleoside deaminase [Chloroflexota bacterium]MBT6682265.1 nucleoside deaminase [Chloroflexota bacterium]